MGKDLFDDLFCPTSNRAEMLRYGARECLMIVTFSKCCIDRAAAVLEFSLSVTLYLLVLLFYVSHCTNVF